jgi:hypothetical protein
MNAGMALLAASLVCAACGSSTTNIAQCGAGTTPVNGVCEVAGGPDATTAEGGAGVPDALQDGPSNDGTAGSSSDVTYTDALTDLAASDAAVADPCPTPTSAILEDCSGDCIPNNGCAYGGTCGIIYTNPQDSRIFQITNTPAFLRTENAPDSHCDEQCSTYPDSGTYAKIHPDAALIFRLNDGTGPFQVRVGPPWKINEVNLDTNPVPLVCPWASDTQTSLCLVVTSPTTLLVWTDDPAPPARNVSIQPATDAQPPCP